MISALRNYCCISFFKGSLLSDNKGLLEQPGKHSQAARLFKFTSIEAIRNIEADIKTYIFEATEVEKAGLKVDFKKSPEPVPEELEKKFDEDPILKTAFETLTPGRQRGYILYFSAPKKSQTRITRIEKCIPKILFGEGLHDKYNSMKKK